jgi:transposase InsO family protein
MADNRRFPQGARGQGRSRMRDNGCQPTALACLEACSTLGMHQACTSDDTPKGHAATERSRLTLKEECLWLQAWTSPLELIRALDSGLETYNNHDLHSALGDKPPRQFERDDLNRHSPPFVAA